MIVTLHEPPAPPTRHEAADVREFLASRYDRFPPSGRIYHGSVDQEHDVTPQDEAGVALLGALPGPFHVIVHPASVEDLLWIVPPLALGYQSLKLAGDLLRQAIIPTPDAPAAGKNARTSSPNNDPFNRQNQGRPFSRIPDLFGTVLAVPDLLCVPYKRFVGHTEVEFSYFCLGRGRYDVSRIRDGSTMVSQIPDASLWVFGPDTSPNSGAAQLSIGSAITEPFLAAKRIGAVEGQTLPPPNKRVTNAPGDTTIGFSLSSSSIEAPAGAGIDFTDFVEPTDTVVVDADHMYPDLHTVPLDGSYVVTAVSELSITLSDPASVNAEWNNLPGGTYWASLGAQLDSTRTRYVGPFFCGLTDATQVLVNVVASNGLYRIEGASGADQGKQFALQASMYFEVAPCADGINPTGAWVEHGVVLRGSSTAKTQQGVTGSLSISEPCLIRARRITYADYTSVGTVVDEVKWRDCYQVTLITAAHFGDVTTIRMALPRTRTAIYEHERKLNLLATRCLPRYGVAPVDADGFSTALLPTNNAADILLAVCRDPRIGRRGLAELDVVGIHAAVADVVQYFGTELAAEFCATLDADGMSFEETAASIASAIHCTAYRQGSQVRLKFERETPDAVLLFNHRNKVPGSETRAVSFGATDDHDGVEYQFVDAATDDELATLYLPADQSAMNSQKVESVGVRNRLQAYLLAHRVWNRQRYQAITTEFEGLQEADLLVQSDRILVADNTRPETQDGEVRGQNGLILTLSQPVMFQGGKTYTIFLQLSDGTVESIPAMVGPSAYEVVLSRAPRLALAVEPEGYARTTYQLVADDDPRERAFLVTEKEPQAKLTSVVRAVNYDDRYYANDRDFLEGVVDEDGYPV